MVIREMFIPISRFPRASPILKLIKFSSWKSYGVNLQTHRPLSSLSRYYVSNDPVVGRIMISNRKSFPVIAQKRMLFIQTETTPNTDALKFIPGSNVLPEGSKSVEYNSGREAVASPLAKKLFTVDGVKSVFYGPDFITVTKDSDAQWQHLKPEIFSLIMEYVTTGQPIILSGDIPMAQDTAPQEDDSEIVSMIKELLETRVRPAIQEDGGDIEYRGYDEVSKTVKLKLQGACKTCDSSTVTLKNGIENMMVHYIGEEHIQNVIQVLDPEEEISLKEFEKFEKKLLSKQS